MSTTTQVRYEAEWIAKQYIGPDGEGDPDRDVYARSHHATKEDAEQAAITASKAAGECEWILVAEQKFVHRYGWRDVGRWTGDWDGLSEETFRDEAEAA